LGFDNDGFMSSQRIYLRIHVSHVLIPHSMYILQLCF